MASSHGKFVWYDLMTTDTAAATAFYGAVIGWDAVDAGLPDRQYTILHAGSAPMGGLLALPQSALDAGARPSWNGYIAVDDVDAIAARIVDAGGAIVHAPNDIPGVGRFAIVTDPQGAAFSLFKALDKPAASAAPFGTPGHVGWHELGAINWEAAFAFYAGVFGWTKADAVDMGPMGTYQLFAIDDMPVGGMMNRMDGQPAASWSYYFNVDEVNAAVARVQNAGGQVVNGPHQVPGGSWIAHGVDPQGGSFAITGPRV
jgi:predicted enzyme related to lactoylglutathione lyase